MADHSDSDSPQLQLQINEDSNDGQSPQPIQLFGQSAATSSKSSATPPTAVTPASPTLLDVNHGADTNKSPEVTEIPNPSQPDTNRAIQLTRLDDQANDADDSSPPPMLSAQPEHLPTEDVVGEEAQPITTTTADEPTEPAVAPTEEAGRSRKSSSDSVNLTGFVGNMARVSETLTKQQKRSKSKSVSPLTPTTQRRMSAIAPKPVPGQSPSDVRVPPGLVGKVPAGGTPTTTVQPTVQQDVTILHQSPPSTSAIVTPTAAPQPQPQVQQVQLQPAMSSQPQMVHSNQGTFNVISQNGHMIVVNANGQPVGMLQSTMHQGAQQHVMVPHTSVPQYAGSTSNYKPIMPAQPQLTPILPGPAPSTSGVINVQHQQQQMQQQQGGRQPVQQNVVTSPIHQMQMQQQIQQQQQPQQTQQNMVFQSGVQGGAAGMPRPMCYLNGHPVYRTQDGRYVAMVPQAAAQQTIGIVPQQAQQHPQMIQQQQMIQVQQQQQPAATSTLVQQLSQPMATTRPAPATDVPNPAATAASSTSTPDAMAKVENVKSKKLGPDGQFST